MPTRRLTAEMKISKTSIHRILREDLRCFPYKKPKLTDFQKRKRIKFANWVLNNYTKNDTKRWLFLDEKYFDLNGIYNSQNDRVWTVSREEGDKRGLSVSVIFDDRSMDAQRYINEILPIALESGNRMLGNDWTYQQNGTRPHIHHLSQKWFADHFPSFISKDRPIEKI